MSAIYDTVAIEAEQCVLGAILLDGLNAFDQINGKMSEVDFLFSGHAEIFNAVQMMAVEGCPINYLTVAEKLGDEAKYNGQPALSYLFEITSNTPTVAHAGHYVNIVKRSAAKRNMREKLLEGQKLLNAPGDAFENIARVQDMISNAVQVEQSPNVKSASESILTAVEEIQRRFDHRGDITGLPTGFAQLDEKTSGLQKGDLIIVAGRPSMGKTAFAIGIGTHVALHQEETVVAFSLEMGHSQLAMRQISSVGNIDSQRLRSGKLWEGDWDKLTAAVSRISAANFFIDDNPSATVATIRSTCRNIKREHGLGLVIVDYLQLMEGVDPRKNRNDQVGEISRGLKALAREFDVPVIALSQLNRGLEQRQNKRPIMADLRESGAIEQDADLIVFLYRDEVYNTETQDKGVAEIIIGKQRNGPLGEVRVHFVGETTSFIDPDATSMTRYRASDAKHSQEAATAAFKHSRYL